MIVATTGYRGYTDEDFVRSNLDWWRQWCYYRHDESLYIRVGDAPGADLFVRRWCQDNEISHRVFRADWDRFGRGKGSPAGPTRNREMLLGLGDHLFAGYRADLLVGFPRTDGAHITVPGSGTWGCIIMAAGLGIKVLIPAYNIKGGQ